MGRVDSQFTAAAVSMYNTSYNMLLIYVNLSLTRALLFSRVFEADFTGP